MARVIGRWGTSMVQVKNDRPVTTRCGVKTTRKTAPVQAITTMVAKRESVRGRARAVPEIA